MFKKLNKKGFTLAELLIVVAIIGVLVAVSIPIFTAQLDKAKDATNLANARSLYAQLTADYLDDNTLNDTPIPTARTGKVTGKVTVTYGSNTFDFQEVKDAELTIVVTGQPSVTYKDISGVEHKFGTSN